MEGEWEREKEKILNSLLGPSQELDFPSEAEVSVSRVFCRPKVTIPPSPQTPQVVRMTPLSMQGRSALDAVAMAYAREVYVRNESSLQGLTHNLVTAFHNASSKFVDKVG